MTNPVNVFQALANEARDAVLARTKADPDLEKLLRASWSRVHDAAMNVFVARRPRMKSFEVTHEMEFVRSHYLIAIHEGKDTFHAELYAMEALYRLEAAWGK